MTEKMIIKLYLEGLSVRQISKRLNLKRKDVKSIITEYVKGIKPIRSVIEQDFSHDELLSDYYFYRVKNALDKGDFKIVDKIDGRSVIVPKDFDYSEKIEKEVVSLYQAYHTHKAVYPWMGKLSEKEKRKVMERFNLSNQYYEDSLNLENSTQTMFYSLTLACEILVEIIARMVTRCVKHGKNLDSSFRRRHAVKLRWGVTQNLFVLLIRKRGKRFEKKLRGEPLGDSPRNMLKILKKEGLDQEFVREKVFTDARYMSDKKLMKYIEQHYLPNLKKEYGLISAIMDNMLKDLPLAIGEDRENGDLLIGLPILHNNFIK